MTVIEISIAMGLLSVLLAVAMTFITLFQRTVQTAAERSIANDTVRLAVQRMDRLIRSGNIIYDPSDTAYGTGDGMQLRVYTQANGDQKCVEWRISGSALDSRSWDPLWQTTDPGLVEGWSPITDGLANAAISPVEPAFSLDAEQAEYGSRVLRVRLLTSEDLDDHEARVEASITGRNTQFDYPVAVCATAPPDA